MQMGEIKPTAYNRFSLNAITSNQLVLHGGSTPEYALNSDTWILDLPSQTWEQYTSTKDHRRCSHAACLGLNTNVIIIGGTSTDTSPSIAPYDIVFHVRFEPKSLQQLAIQTVHQSDIPWDQYLPKKLTDLFTLPRKEEDIGNASDAMEL